MGEGPINYDWNSRFVVLDKELGSLSWYDSEYESKQKGAIIIGDYRIEGPIQINEMDCCFQLTSQTRTVSFRCQSDLEAEFWVANLEKCAQRETGFGTLDVGQVGSGTKDRSKSLMDSELLSRFTEKLMHGPAQAG